MELPIFFPEFSKNFNHQTFQNAIFLAAFIVTLCDISGSYPPPPDPQHCSDCSQRFLVSPGAVSGFCLDLPTETEAWLVGCTGIPSRHHEMTPWKHPATSSRSRHGGVQLGKWGEPQSKIILKFPGGIFSPIKTHQSSVMGVPPFSELETPPSHGLSKTQSDWSANCDTTGV